MTPVSTGLTILGLIGISWPLATLLFKRHVLNAQWVSMLALSLISFSFILLGCRFNRFLMSDHLLYIIFLDVILINPPIIYLALSVLTQKQSSRLSLRILFLPSLITIALTIASVIIGGPDIYLQWLDRGMMGLSGSFYPNSWRYNLIVFANFYLFWAVFSFEAIFIFFACIRKYLQFQRSNSEYFTTDRFQNLNLKGLFIATNLCLGLTTFGPLINVFDPDNMFLFYLVYCLPLAVCLFYIGRSIYNINSGAEKLPSDNIRAVTHNDYSLLGHQIEEYVEKERAYLNPDISVFIIAEHLHTSEDDVIDTIHQQQGTSFGNYIDGLRIELATKELIDNPSLQIDDPEVIEQLAHKCGYLNGTDFQRAFTSVMHMSLPYWYNQQAE